MLPSFVLLSLIYSRNLDYNIHHFLNLLTLGGSEDEVCSFGGSFFSLVILDSGRRRNRIEFPFSLIVIGIVLSFMYWAGPLVMGVILLFSLVAFLLVLLFSFFDRFLGYPLLLMIFKNRKSISAAVVVVALLVSCLFSLIFFTGTNFFLFLLFNFFFFLCKGKCIKENSSAISETREYFEEEFLYNRDFQEWLNKTG